MMQKKGRISSWNDAKEFGFITPIGGSKQIFVHIKSFSNRNGRPALNQVVSYTVSHDKNGRTCAENVSIPSNNSNNLNTNVKQSNSSSFFSIILALMFLGIIFLLGTTGKIPTKFILLYFGVSIVTFVIYAVDKSAAINGRWRTPEKTLHFLSIFGGWPGALVAQSTLSHKSKKQSFRSIFFATVAINLAGLAWLIISKTTISPY